MVGDNDYSLLTKPLVATRAGFYPALQFSGDPKVSADIVCKYASERIIHVKQYILYLIHMHYAFTWFVCIYPICYN